MGKWLGVVPGGGGGGVNISAGTTSNNLSSVVFSNLNGVTFGLNGSTVTASHNALTSQSNQAFSAQGGSSAFQTLVFGNSFGVSFSNSAGSVMGSVAAQSAQTQNVVVPSAGTQTATSGTVVFSNSNGITFGMSGSTRITASHNGLTTAAASDHSHGNPTLNLTNLSGTTASNSAGFTLSLSAAAAGVGAAVTKSRFNPFVEAVAVAGQIGQASLQMHPCPGGENFQFDRVCFDITVQNSFTTTNSSGSATISLWGGIYTRNVSTLSLVVSSSTSQGLTGPGTQSSTLYQGARLLTMGWTTTITNPDIWFGIVSRTTTGGVNKFSISQYVASDVADNYSGLLGGDSNATAQNLLGLGIYTATTSGMPASIAFSQLNGTNATALRIPLYYFLSQTA